MKTAGGPRARPTVGSRKGGNTFKYRLRGLTTDNHLDIAARRWARGSSLDLRTLRLAS